MALLIRSSEARDLDALGRMGAALARLHHEFDPPRFMLADDLEAGYRWWLEREQHNKKAIVLVAELDGEVVGYCYGRVEGRDWNKLLDGYGELIDLWVDESARRTGAGKKLSEAMFARLSELGVPRVVVMSASKNKPAQALFERLGWRHTMVELTREVEPPVPGPQEQQGRSKRKGR